MKDGRMGPKKKAPRVLKKRPVSWESEYEPGENVEVFHHSSRWVPAVLVRQRFQPTQTWVARKLIYGEWTGDVVVVERCMRKTT